MVCLYTIQPFTFYHTYGVRLYTIQGFTFYHTYGVSIQGIAFYILQNISIRVYYARCLTMQDWRIIVVSLAHSISQLSILHVLKILLRNTEYMKKIQRTMHHMWESQHCRCMYTTLYTCTYHKRRTLKKYKKNFNAEYKKNILCTAHHMWESQHCIHAPIIRHV